MISRFTLTLALAGSVLSSLHAQRPAALVAFGDSLSDNGNLFALTGQPPVDYGETQRDDASGAPAS